MHFGMLEIRLDYIIWWSLPALHDN